MEHWLQCMCCALAVVLVLYFGEVGGRLREDKREDKELLKSIFKLLYSRVSRSLYTMENHSITNGGGADE